MPLKMAIGDYEFSSILMWTIRYCGDGPGPRREIRGAFKVHATEEMPSAARCPRFRYQGAVSKTGVVRTKIIKDFVNDLDGNVTGVSVALEESGS